MALIVCPECGCQVSSSAKSCIQCGYPVGVIIKTDLVNNILQDAAIEQLNLSFRTYKLLFSAGIKTVSDLCKLDLVQVMKIPDLGKKSLEEITSRLLELGLRLRDGDENATVKNIEKKMPITKYDWCCEKAPKKFDVSSFEYAYKPRDLEKLKLGFKPTNMDQKWFSYYEGGVIHFYRSWTGNLIYRVILNESNKHIVFSYDNGDNGNTKWDPVADVQALIQRLIDDEWDGL